MKPLAAMLGVIFAILIVLNQYSNAYVAIGIAIFLGILGIINFVLSLFIVHASYSVFGKQMWEQIDTLQPYRQVAVSPHSFIGPWFIAWGVLVLGLGVMMQPLWLGVGIFLLCSWWSNFSRRILPPFALVLGDTGNSTRDVALRVFAAVGPLQTTDLLKVLPNRLRGDTLRGAGDSQVKAVTSRLPNDLINWKDAVGVYGTIAKVIVLRMEEPTPYVLDEARIIDEAKLWSKVIIVGDINKVRSGLLTAGVDIDAVESIALFCDEKSLFDALTRLKTRYIEAPTENVCLSHLFRNVA